MKPRIKCVGMALIVIAVLTIGYVGTSQCALLDENTMAYWSFDEGEGDILKDASDNGNDGNIDGAVWIDGRYGKALEFDGDDDVVEVSDADSLHTTDLTVTAWINVYSDPDTWSGTNAAGIVFKLNEYQWNVENTGLLWFGIWGAALRSNYDFTDHLNEWHHVAIIFDGGTQEGKIYVDGEVDIEGTVAEQVDPSSSTLLIGSKDEAGVEFFHGVIDEIEMSSVVRDQAEIKADMAGVAVNARGKLTTTWGALKRRY